MKTIGPSHLSFATGFCLFSVAALIVFTSLARAADPFDVHLCWRSSASDPLPLIAETLTWNGNPPAITGANPALAIDIGSIYYVGQPEITFGIGGAINIKANFGWKAGFSGNKEAYLNFDKAATDLLSNIYTEPVRHRTRTCQLLVPIFAVQILERAVLLTTTSRFF